MNGTSKLGIFLRYIVVIAFVALPALLQGFQYPYIQSSGSSLGTWTKDYESAVANAKSTGKPIVFVGFHECDHGCALPLTSLDQDVKTGSYLVCMNHDSGKTGYRSDVLNFYSRLAKSSVKGQCTLLYGGRRAGEVAEKFGTTHALASSVLAGLASRYPVVAANGSTNVRATSSEYANALNVPQLFFTTSSGAPWLLSGESANFASEAHYSTGVSVRSGLTEDSGESWLQTTVAGPSSITFKWLVSSEERYDKLSFFVDGVVQETISGKNEFCESGWETITHDIPYGSHTLTWKYTKDGSVSDGMDGGWIADLKVETVDLPSFNVGFVGVCGFWNYQYTYGDVLGTIEDITKDGCASGLVFDGWYTSDTGGTKVSSDTPVTCDVTYYARWKPALTAKPVIDCESTYSITPGVSCSIPVKARSTIKATTVSLSGLPKGLYFKSGKITGKVTKPGTYKVVVTAKNSKGTVRKSVTLKANNPGFDVTVRARINGSSSSDAVELGSGDTVQFYVGVQQTISIASSPRLSGVSSSAATVSVSGLPKGLTYKSGKISGVVRTKGSRTATIRFKNKWGWSKSFKIVFKAVSLPSAVTGSFNGFVGSSWDWMAAHEYAGEERYDEEYDEEYDEDYGDERVNYGGWLRINYVRDCPARISVLKVSASSTGKITAKLGSTTFTASKWSNCIDGVFSATLTYGAKKLVIYVDKTKSWKRSSMEVVYDPLGIHTCHQVLSGYAVRNPFSKKDGVYVNAEAGHMVKLLAKKGATPLAIEKWNGWTELICGSCIYTPPNTVYKYPLSVKVSTSGLATLTGKIGSKSISASAPVRILENGSALATFITNGLAIDLEWDYTPATSSYWDEYWEEWLSGRPECYFDPIGGVVKPL